MSSTPAHTKEENERETKKRKGKADKEENVRTNLFYKDDQKKKNRRQH